MVVVVVMVAERTEEGTEDVDDVVNGAGVDPTGTEEAPGMNGAVILFEEEKVDGTVGEVVGAGSERSGRT